LSLNINYNIYKEDIQIYAQQLKMGSRKIKGGKGIRKI